MDPSTTQTTPAAPHRWLVVLAVMTGTIMSTLDASIINVALPHMQGSFGASVEEIAWVATSYLLASVITMPITGMFAARFGRKRYYLFSVVLFVVSSALCGLAWNLPSMVLFRILQGIGSGTLIPVSQSVLRETFPPEEQGTAMGIYGFGVVLGPAAGPMVGGWLTDNYSWPWIFFVNLPIGAAAILMVIRFVHDPPYLVRETGRMDWAGLACMVVGLAALQLMLEKGQQKDWFDSRLIVGLGATAAVSFVLFVWRELTAARPAVDLRLLKNVNFASGGAIGAILGMGLNSSLFLQPLFLQHLLGYSAWKAGLVLMPRSAAMALTFLFTGRFYNRLGPRVLIGVGLVVSIGSFWELSRLSLDVGFWDVFWPQTAQGIGFGLIFVALSTVALSTIERAKMTSAAGLYNVLRQIAGSIGIAVFATQLTSAVTSNRALMVGHISEYRPESMDRLHLFQAAMGRAVGDPVVARQMALRMLDGQLMREAGMLAYNHIFSLIAVCFVLAMPLVFILRGGARRAPGVEEVLAE